MRALVLALLCLIPAAAAAQDGEPPAIEHTAKPSTPTGQGLVIEAQMRDPSGIFAPTVYVRTVGVDRSFVSIAMQAVGPELYRAEVPASRVRGRIQYFIEAFDEMGNGPARVGSPDAPLEVEAVEPPPLPKVETLPPKAAVRAEPPEAKDEDDGGILSTWWFWTLVGVAAAGGAAGAYLATQGGPRDQVTVAITGPNPTEGL